MKYGVWFFLAYIIGSFVVGFLVLKLLGCPTGLALLIVTFMIIIWVVMGMSRDWRFKPSQQISQILVPGTYLVVCGKVDTVSPEAGNGKEHRVEVVLVVRPLGNSSAEPKLVIIPKERLIKGNLANSARAITENYPSFCLKVESDGTRVLFQETAEAVRLHELVFSP